jgi:hypothetical protein
LEVGYLLLRFALVSATRKESARRCPALSFADRAWISMVEHPGVRDACRPFVHTVRLLILIYILVRRE